MIAYITQENRGSLLPLYFVCLYFIFSCNSNLVESEYSFTTKDFEIAVNEVIILPLDSETMPFEPIRGFAEPNHFYFYNSLNNHIYYYDLGDRLHPLDLKIPVPLDAAINFRNASEVYFHNLDSIFIWDEGNIYSDFPDLFLINRDGQVVNSYSVVNVRKGDAMKLSRIYTNTGPTLFYYDGKILVACGLGENTKTENLKPLLVYDLKTGEKNYEGEFPSLPEIDVYAQFTWSFQTTLNPDKGELFFSWAYDEDLYKYSIAEDEWSTLNMESDFFSTPPPMTIKDEVRSYVNRNDWFMSIFYDPYSGSIYRSLLLGLTEDGDNYNVSQEIPGLQLSRTDRRFITFRIDQESNKVDIIPKLSPFRISLFHPKLEPLIQTQLHDELGLDPQNTLILAPLKIR